MAAIIKVSKLEAAQTQLDAAIRMLFDGAKPVVTHTLIGAASVLLTDLVEAKVPHKSWDRMAQEANGLSPTAYFSIMRKAQNFFKHARDDADAVLDFDAEDTDALAFWAVMNAGELAPLSMEASVFQLWYIASYSPSENPGESPLREAIELFGDLRSSPRELKLAAGRRVFQREVDNAG